MKKLITFAAMFLGIIACTNGQATKQEIFKLDQKRKSATAERTRGLNPDQSIFLYYSTQFDTTYREFYKYVAGTSNVEEVVTQFFNSGVYENSSKTENTYTASGLLKTSIQYNWDGTAWEPASKTNNTYDQFENETENSYYFWDQTAWVLTNGNKNVYTYNAANKILTKTGSNWDGTAWVPNYRETNTYNASNHQISVLNEMYDNGNWVNSNKSNYTVNASGHWTEFESYNWNDIDSKWEKDMKAIGIVWLDFDEFLVLEAILQNDDNNTWVNYLKILNTYNTNKNPLTETYQMWMFNNWINASRNLYTYDSKGNETENLSQTFAMTWSTQNGYRSAYTYDAGDNILTIENSELNSGNWDKTFKRINIYPSTVAVQNNTNGTGFNIYPNPVVDKISINLGSEQVATINVFNLTGQKVLGLNTTSNQVTVDLSSLISGAYFIQVNAAETTTTRKFIKQ